MGKYSGLIAVLLVIMFLAPAPGLQSPHAMPAGHPAGCHFPAAPIDFPPAAPHFDCCANGHDWAVPVTGFSGDRLVALHLSIDVADAGCDLISDVQGHRAELFSPSISPRALALRI